MSKTILLTDLQRVKSCPHDYEEFAKLYGEGGVVTLENTMQGALIFDWRRAAQALCPEKYGDFKMRCKIGFLRIPRNAPQREEKVRRMMAKAFYDTFSSE